MLNNPLAHALLLLNSLAPFLAAQAPAPQEFKPNSQLGELYLIGRTESTADKKIVSTAEHVLVSVESARLALRFPNRDRLVVAGENEQLLLLSGTMKNPQQQEITVTSGAGTHLAQVRIFGGAAGQVYHLEMVVESESQQLLSAKLKPGQTAKYTLVLRVPSTRPSLTMALLRAYGPIRRYDFGPVVTRVASAFPSDGPSISSSAKAAVGQVFDLDGLDLKVTSVGEVAKVGAYTGSEGKHLYAVEVQVTNPMLVAAPWGWQFCNPDLKDTSGNSLAWSRDMLDAQSGQTFSKDLAPGESATIVYVFSSSSRVTPGTLALQMLKSKRQVDVALGSR